MKGREASQLASVAVTEAGDNKFDRMSDQELIEHLQRQANELGIKIELRIG
jgi:uncharacterized protein YunC (DUF1805 family)